MISGYPIWVIIVTGAIFVVCLGMTLPIYFNLGGEIIFPIGEAHSQGYSNYKPLSVRGANLKFVRIGGAK